MNWVEKNISSYGHFKWYSFDFYGTRDDMPEVIKALEWCIDCFGPPATHGLIYGWMYRITDESLPTKYYDHETDKWYDYQKYNNDDLYEPGDEPIEVSIQLDQKEAAIFKLTWL